MTFKDVLEYAQGVMFLEGLEFDRSGISSFSGGSDLAKFIRDRKDAIWQGMFPKITDNSAIKGFVARKEVYKQIAEKFSAGGK